MGKYASHSAILSNKIPKTSSQTTPIPGTVENNAGGFVFDVGKWGLLERFLILGTEGNTYYCTEQKMTLDNAKNVIDCIKEDGVRVVNTVVQISDSGRAAKNTPALFALALCASFGSQPTKQLALRSLKKVARIGTHLFQFANFVDQFRGWGRSLRSSIGDWYTSKSPEQLLYQVIKYNRRTTEGGDSSSRWSHKDLLCKTHPVPPSLDHQSIFNYITYDKMPEKFGKNLALLEGFNKLNAATNVQDVVSIMSEYRLPHEVIPKQYVNDPDVWRANLPHLPIGATLRVLNRLTAYNILQPLSQELKMVIDRITDFKLIKSGRIHPIQILAALKTYSSSRGHMGSLTWTPVQKIIDALNDSFYLAFDAVEPTDKNILLALDVSGSMGCGSVVGLNSLTPRDATAVMAMVTARVEKNYHIMGFCDKLVDLAISPKMRLDEVIKVISGLAFGNTDCSLPMTHALRNKMPVDAFCIYTDSETWSGNIKPHEALAQYNYNMRRNAKMAVVATTATKFSIAQPNNPNQMDFVGFDSNAPAAMADFIRG